MRRAVGMPVAPLWATSLAMLTVFETRDKPFRSPATGSGGVATVLPQRPLEPGPFVRRCPDCGREDHSDSELAGACEYCPGIVPLQPA
jgi:hypothetical protein